MFAKKDKIVLWVAAAVLATGFTLMAIDPAKNGFGIATLWIAPPLLLSGFLLVAMGISGYDIGIPWIEEIRSNALKHAVGLVAFTIPLITYLLTLAPTASLWDCGEFIASAYKLQVPHTPGTPLSLLIGRLFTMFSFGDVSKVAWTLNLMSALFSALTVALLFYIICYFGERVVVRSERQSNRVVIFSSFAGSLCLAFSDSFWFSAVEAEIYGLACFFLVLLFWLILSGRTLAEPRRTRRLILIFYLTGLGYCIHPMCVLALSVLPFAWHTTERAITFRNTALCLCAGLAIVMFINRFVAVGLFELSFSFDLFFVNGLHLPFYSGAIALFFALIFLVRMILVRYRRGSAFVWAFVFLVVGFIPYLLLFIRSAHDPPIDETNPENLALIKAYMNRESYPSRPLLYGPYFDARIRDVSARKQVYYKGQDAYKVAGSLPAYHYDSRQTILPRLYSNDPAHIETYRRWTGLKENEKPRYSDNLEFMFRYQLGHMYLRYLMWNFAGRKGDVQNSSWLKPWDRLSSSSFEKARNQYWMIPLILGIAGSVFQFRKDPKGWISTAMFFLITGIILVLYLNATPNEPRERDYIYVGSYIAFCIWIGLGILGVTKLAKQSPWRMAAVMLLSLCVPFWMLHQNYDDHDRSGRTFQVDNARNTLQGCAPGSILFTGGDNDTFPLWYLQEVEGFRTDVRVMVLSYMNTDWYINQLRKTYYDSGAFKFTLGEKDYRQYGANDVLYLEETIETGIDAGQYLQLLKKEHSALQRVSQSGELYHILPSRTLKIALPEAETDMIVSIDNNYLPKNALAILDLIISNEWKRPIQFNFTAANTLGLDLSAYLIDEGPVYRLTLERSSEKNIRTDTRRSYQNLVEHADYSNLQDSGIYFSYEDYYARMLVPVRQSFNALAVAFINENNPEMATKVMTAAMAKLYHKHLRPSYTNLQAAQILMVLHDNKAAERLVHSAFQYYDGQVKAAMCEGNEANELDRYLLMESQKLLDTLSVATLPKPG